MSARRFGIALAALALAVSVHAHSPQAPSSFERSDFERGVEAYRAGQYAEAKAAWQTTLAEPLDELGRARVYFDLGNAHWRPARSHAACRLVDPARQVGRVRGPGPLSGDWRL